MKTTICLSCALSITFLTLLSTCQGQKFTATPSGTYYVTRSKPVTLECEAENVDSMQYACSKELHDSQLTVAGRVSDDGTETLKASLKISKEDIQGYSSRSPFWCECVGDIDSGNPIRSRRSEIKPAFLKKEFKTVPKSKSAPIGSKVEFSCEGPAGQPFPTISWHKNGKKVNTQKDSNFIVNDRGMLIIRRLRQKDLGQYSCIARNIAAKRVSSSATLTIGDASVEDRLEASDAPLEDGPVFEKYPESLYYATAKKPAELTCRVVGANILTVRCNSRRLLDGEQKKQEIPSAQGKIMETTWTVKPEDIRRYGIDGSYSCYCVAWYALPGASGWLNRTSSAGYIEHAFLEERFVAQPQSQTIGVDSSVTFSCSAPRSKPPAEIRWYFNGKPLDLNSGIYVFDETSGSLTLESVTLRDNGDYQCAASNVAGVQYSNAATLTVQEGFVKKVEPKQESGRRQTIPVATVAPTTPARAPGEAYFSTSLKEVYYMTQDKPAEITCAVKNADMITFRCNRRRYENDEITKQQDYNQATRKYDITSTIKVTAEDVAKANGDYRCICTMWYTVGGNWERKESVKAKIEEAFIEEEFAMTPVDSEVQIGVAAELICSPPFGGPEPEVSWLKDGERVDAARDPNVEISLDGSLSILSMRKKYEGSYTCVASNAAGVLYSPPARLTALARTETVTDAITESILVDVSSTAEPLDYTPYTEPEISSEPGRGGTARGSLPMFLEEPKTTYYVVKGQFITITCQAKNVIRIAFRCSGMTVPNYRYDNNQVSSSDMMSVSLELSREDVEGFTDDNSCVCDAFYYKQGTQEEDKISSSPGFINMAYIKKRFQKNPVDTSTMEGMMAALPCTPPEALPRPTVYWLFNGQRLDSKLGTNIVQPDDNSLVFVNPTQDLAGDYTCVAENVAGKRTSNTARLTVEVPSGGEVDQVETTSEPIGEPETATSEPEPEPEGKDGYTTHGDHMHQGHGQHGGHAYPETTEGYFVTSMRGNEIDIGSQPTYSQESESTPEPKEDSDKSVAMVTGESEVKTDTASLTTKDMMVDGSMGEKATKAPMGSKTTKESLMDSKTTKASQMATSSEEMGSIATVSSGMKPATVSSGMKPMSNGSKDMQPMVTDSSVIKPTANQPLATEKSDTDMSNEIDSMNPEEKSTKKPKGLRPKPKSKKFKKCQEKMSVCNRYFTEQVRPAEENQDMEAKCQAAAEYSMCVDEFVDKCKNEIKANAIDTILYTRDRLTSSCRNDVGVVHTDLGPYESCNELQMCTRHLTEGDSIFDNVHSACNSLTSMLMCGDSALSKCNIENSANGETSLSSIGEWYAKYCNKVIMERTSFVTCESLRPCNTPFNASTSVKDMYDVNKWCPYTRSVISCTNNALDNCEPEDREAIEADLRMLQAEASDICPTPGASEEVIDIGSSKDNDGGGASTLFSTSSIFLSCVHVVLVIVLSLR